MEQAPFHCWGHLHHSAAAVSHRGLRYDYATSQRPTDCAVDGHKKLDPSSQVDNVFTTTNMEGLVVVCDTDPVQRAPGTDHVPILTTLDILIPHRDKKRWWDFRGTDWDEFRKVLGAQLGDILVPCALWTESQFQNAVRDLTKALQVTIETAVPLSHPSPHLRRWWNKDLAHRKKEMNCLVSQAYKFRTVEDHPAHSAFRNARTEYGVAIKQAKEQHWKVFWRR